MILSPIGSLPGPSKYPVSPQGPRKGRGRIYFRQHRGPRATPTGQPAAVETLPSCQSGPAEDVPSQGGSRGRAFPLFLPVSSLFSGCSPDGTPHPTPPASQSASYCAINTSMKEPLKNPLKKECNVTNRPLIYGSGNLHFLHVGLPRDGGGGRDKESLSCG